MTTKTEIDYFIDAIRRNTTIPLGKLDQIVADYEEKKAKAELQRAINQTVIALQTFSDPPFSFVKTEKFSTVFQIDDLSHLYRPEDRQAFVEAMQADIAKQIAGREVIRIEANVERVAILGAYQLSLSVYVRSED